MKLTENFSLAELTKSQTAERKRHTKHAYKTTRTITQAYS